MCLPGLHITLGIFNRLFDLLERKCQELDLALASQQVAQGGETFNRYIAALKRHGDLEEELENQEHRIVTFVELLSYLMVTVPEPLENGVVQGVIENKDAAEMERDAMVIILNTLCLYLFDIQVTEKNDLGKVLVERFRKRDGPFFKSLEVSLQKLHVQRQSFHGATFVGNHVHKLLKVRHTLKACSH